MTTTTAKAITARLGSESMDWKPLGVLLLGTFLIVLDFFIVNVALPSIQHHLHASPAQLEWVIAGSGLTFAVLLMTGGRVGDLIGRRRAFCIGIGIFVIASAVCGLAPSPSALITARLVQGVGAALISPNVLSIIGVSYPGAQRARAISAYGIVMGLAAIFGQVTGGLLIDANIAHSAWRPIFLLNVPVGVVALVLTRRIVSESNGPAGHRLDTGGVVLATLGLLALVLPLVQGRQLGWPLWTWVSLALSPIFLGLLWRQQHGRARAGREPLLHPDTLRNPKLRAGFAIQVACWCSQAAFFLVLSLYLQNGRHLSAVDAGLMFMILAGAYLPVSMCAPRLAGRYGPKVITAGVLTAAAGNIVLLLAASHAPSSLIALAPGLLLAGAGQGLWIAPLTGTVLSFAEPQRAGLVSGALSTMQQVGNSLGVAITGIVFFAALHRGYERAFAHSLVELTGMLLLAAILTAMLARRPKPRSAAGDARTAGGRAQTR